MLQTLVDALNSYKRYIELDLIFDADQDFLYRQKGQLKLDNTILEEFLPYLFDIRLVPGLTRVANLNCGPQSSFAGLRAFSDLNESLGIPKTARVRFKLHAGEGGQHAWPRRFPLIFAKG